MISKDLIYREYSAILNSKEGRNMTHQEALSRAVSRVDDFEQCIDYFLRKENIIPPLKSDCEIKLEAKQ